MLALMLTPAVLSLLVLAAHFLRRGQMVPCVATLAMLVVLLAVRRPWVPRVTQVVLVAGALRWAWTLAGFVRQRAAEGEPAGRLVAILGAVIAINLLAALLLGLRRVTRRYAGAASQAPAAH